MPLLQIEAVPPVSVPADPVPPEEISELIESFRIGYGNLHEIWALILPPQTLLGLKRLSRLPNDSFSLPDALWVRVIYDYVLAHRLRTINRGHLLGSLTPLYLAWVASHILSGQQGGSSGGPDALSRAFEADKPYLVSRWRWPDRFNP
jgi:glucosylglycerate synthase